MSSLQEHLKEKKQGLENLIRVFVGKKTGRGKNALGGWHACLLA